MFVLRVRYTTSLFPFVVASTFHCVYLTLAQAVGSAKKNEGRSKPDGNEAWVCAGGECRLQGSFAGFFSYVFSKEMTSAKIAHGDFE